MKTLHFTSRLAVVLILLNACSKIKYYPDKEFREVKTRVLAHKAGGGEGAPYPENCLNAAIYSLSQPRIEGIEVDLQLSKDRTLWLSHSVDLPACGSFPGGCFPETTDAELVALDSCDGPAHTYTRLEDVFAYMAAHHPDKYISLDVKGWTPCAVSSISVTGVMNGLADQIALLTQKYGLQNHVMAESETATFLNYLKKYSTGVECYLVTLGDFERGLQLVLQSGYTGLSFKYKFKEELTEGHIQLLRRKGLKIQLWTVDAEENLEEALTINPDFIQTDSLNYFK